MKNNFNNNFTYLLILIIIFSNPSFGKEFKGLFEINHKIESGMSVEKSLNKSFDKMIYRLSGSSNPSNIWKIINSGVDRKDFIISYSINEIDKSLYLTTQFNQELLEEQFKKLTIPIIGKSRPTFILIAKIDNGINQPYYLNDEAKIEFDFKANNLLDDISETRGLFIDTPILDLKDAQVIQDFNYLLDTNEYLSSRYNVDEIINLEITKIDSEKWSVTGDFNKTINSKNFQDEFLESFESFLHDKASSALKNYQIEFLKINNLSINISNIKSIKDYEDVIDELNGIIGMEKLKINALIGDSLILDIYFFDDSDKFMNRINDSTKFTLTEISNRQQDVHIEFKK